MPTRAPARQGSAHSKEGLETTMADRIEPEQLIELAKRARLKAAEHREQARRVRRESESAIVQAETSAAALRLPFGRPAST